MSRAEHYPKVPKPRKPRRSPKETRNRQIALRVIVGWESMRAVADDHGISSERVRQIVNLYDPDHQCPTSGRITMVNPNSDPLARREGGGYRNKPLRDPRQGRRRQSKAWRQSRNTRLRILGAIGEWVEKHGEMPTIRQMKEAMGIDGGNIQHSFSGVFCYRTGMRRICRLLGCQPRGRGYAGWTDRSKEKRSRNQKGRP